MAEKKGIAFPRRLFPHFGRERGLDELNALDDRDVYMRLHEALEKVGHLESLEPKGRKLRKSKRKQRVQTFLLESGFERRLVNRLCRIFSEENGNFKRMKSIKAVEAKVVLDFLDNAGFDRYKNPALAFAGEEDMLFHSFAAFSGAPNTGAITRESFHELYEMYSVDVGPVLAEQGRYNIFCGYLEIESNSGDNVVHARFMQPSGAAPGGSGREEYHGYFFAQDDTCYVMGFKGSEDEGRDGNLNEVGGAPSFERVKKTPKGQRKNLAMLVVNGFSRNADGLYNKLVGGQVGRGLTGATGVLSSPCVLYRVTDQRVHELESLMYQRSKDERDFGDRDMVYKPVFDRTEAISTQEKVSFYKSKIIRTKSFISGIDLIDVGVMSDLNIPVPLQSDEEKIDVNVYKGS